MKKIIIGVSKVANKFFSKHSDIYDKFIENIKSVYHENNHNVDIKTMKGYKDIYRMRVQQYRIIYKLIDNEAIIINVITAGKRGDIYKDFKNK